MKTNDCFRHRLMPLALWVLLCGVTALNAATATLERTVLPAGGGAAAAAANYTLTDTLGQPVVGNASSANYTLAAGFWPDSGGPPVPAAMGLGVPAGQTTAFDDALAGADGDRLATVQGNNDLVPVRSWG